MIRKRPFLFMCFTAFWVFAGAGATALAAQSPQIPLPGTAIPKYVNQLPLLSIDTTKAPYNTMLTVLGNGPLTVRMCEFSANVLPTGFIPPAGWPSTFTGMAGSGIFTVGKGIFVGTTWATATKKAILTVVGGTVTDPVLTYTLIAPSVDFVSDDPVLEADPATGTLTGVSCIAGTPVQLRTSVFGYIVGDSCPPLDTPLETYLGPVIVNGRNDFSGDSGTVPTTITFVNDLGSAATTRVLAFRYATDQTMHWADPLGAEQNDCAKNISPGELPTPDCQENYQGPIPAVPHLHGGEVPPELDGGPDAWFTNLTAAYPFGIKGHAYHTYGSPDANAAIYRYPNTQEAAPIWFHDHVLGITRLNVFAGLAGAYLITDPNLTLPTGLHPAGLQQGAAGVVEYTVPLVIQDRMFDTNGQLFYQSDSAGGVLWATNPEHPYWTPEFLGDVIVVNGKAWPNLNVEPKRYRFLLINGSNARTYELRIPNPATVTNLPLYVIATDGGYLDAPAMTNKLVIMPGERYDVIIDFQGFAGTRLTMRNSAKSPYPAGAAVQGNTTGQIMQFTVSGVAVADNSYNPATYAPGPPEVNPIRPDESKIVRLANPVNGTFNGTPDKTRLLTLNEVMGMNPNGVLDPFTNQLYPGGPLEVLVNNTKYGGESLRPYNDFTTVTTGADTTYYSELPEEGSTEVWEIVNITADAHPIHLHLVQFQIINRQNFDAGKYIATYIQAFPQVEGDPVCTGGVFCPGFGPPKSIDPDANTLSGGKWGGNPDVAAKDLKGKFLYLKQTPIPPLPQEAGWKDTVVAYPNQVTRLAVRWAPTDLLTTASANTLYYPFDPRGTVSSEDYAHGYVWHCHIIDHEDNEMMRPFAVALNPAVGVPIPAERPLVKGAAY